RRNRCSRNCTDHFRPHCCAARFGKCLAKTGEMAADRDRSDQAMRPELAAARSRSKKIGGIFFCFGAVIRSSPDRIAPARRAAVKKNSGNLLEDRKSTRLNSSHV